MTFQDTGQDPGISQQLPQPQQPSPPGPLAQAMPNPAPPALLDRPPPDVINQPMPQPAPSADDASGFLEGLIPKVQMDAQFEALTPPPRLPPEPLPGTPTRLPFFQRVPQYRPSMPNRPAREWAKDHFTLTGAQRLAGVAPGPWMPAPWEIPGILQGVGQQLQRWGSRSVSPLGGQLASFSQQHSKAYLAGQMAATRYLYEQMRLKALQVEERQRQQLEEYGKIFAEYGDDNPDALHDALQDAADKFGDDHMSNALKQGGVQAAHRLQQYLDARHSDLKKSNTQLQKEEQQRKLDEPYLKNPTDAAGTPVPRTTPEDTDTKDDDKPATHPGTDEPLPDKGPGLSPPDDDDTAPTDQQGAADQPQRMQLAMAGNQLPTREPDLASPVGEKHSAQNAAQPSSPTLQRADREGFDWRGINTDGVNAFHNGGIRSSDRKQWSDRRAGLVDARRIEVERELEAIQQDPTLKGSAVYRAVDRVVPGFGTQIGGYVDGSIPLPKQTSRVNPMMRWVLGLGKKADPSFDGQAAQQRFGMVKEYTRGNLGRLLIGMPTADRHLQTMLRAIDEVERSGRLPGEMGAALNRAYQFLLREGPQRIPIPGTGREFQVPGMTQEGLIAVGNFEALVHLVAPEIARAQKGGNPTLSETKDVEKVFSAANNPALLRQVVQSARHLFHQRAAAMNDSFKRGVGRDPVKGIGALLDNFEREGVAFDEPKGKDELNTPVPQNLGGGSRSDAWRGLQRQQDPGVPAYDPFAIGGQPAAAVPGSPPPAGGAQGGGLAPGWNVRVR